MSVDAVANTLLEFEREPDNQAWARWLARGLDAVFLTPVQLIAFAGLGVAVELGRAPAVLLDWMANPIIAAVVGVVVTFLFFCLWEPLFISNMGTTPGKWVMGIRVHRADGSKLGPFAALWRFVWVWTVGLGFGVPLLSLVMMLVARARLISSGVTAWDEELKVTVTHRKRHPFVWFAVIVGVIGINAAFRILERMA